MTGKRFTIDVEENTQENALFEDDKFVCFEDDTDEYLKKINEMSDENEELKSKNRGLQSELQIFKEDVSRSNLQINKLADENEKLNQLIQQKITDVSERTGYLFTPKQTEAALQVLNELKNELKT